MLGTMFSVLVRPCKDASGSIYRVIEPNGGSALVETIEGGTWGPRPEAPSIEEVRGFAPASVVEVAEALGRSTRWPASKMRESAQPGLLGADEAVTIVDAMVEHARLSGKITKAQNQLARAIARARRLGVGERSRAIVKAKGELAALGAKRDQLDHEFLGEP